MGKKKVKESDTPSKEEFDAVELVTKKPQTVILMLQSVEESVLQTVCEALFKYSEKSQENKAQIISLGALEHMIKLLNHEEKGIKRAAVMCVGTLSSETASKNTLRKSNCIQSLLNLLSPEEEAICHEFSTLTLSYLAEEYSNRVEIFDKYGLPLLINHLQSADCDVQKNSVQTISYLVNEFKSRAAIRDLDGIEHLLTLLNSEYPIIQELALNTLTICCQNAENREALRDLDGLSKLVDMIGTETLHDLHTSCLKCFAVCLEDTESLKLIQSTGVFDKLLAFISEPNTDPQIQEFTALVISAASKQEVNRKIFHEQETEKTLISLLTSDSISVVINAVEALANLSENLVCRESIGKLDGLPPIIKLLTNDNPKARQISSLALANLTNSNVNNCQICIEKNTIDPLIKLLSDHNGVIQCNAAICLSNFALNEPWRVELKKHGAVKGLIDTLNSDNPDVQLNGCQALSAFLCDADARRELLHLENGLKSVVNLLHSNDGAVRRNASWVIMLCAVDTDLAEEITKCGGLEILETLNLSSRRNGFTEIAFERLLNGNLPAKYAIYGVLKFDNVIENVFYDAGKIRPGCPFRTLLEHSSENVNHARPVLLVNPKINLKKHSHEENKPVVQPKQSNMEKPAEKPRGRSKNERRQSKSRIGKESREDGKDTLTVEKVDEQSSDISTTDVTNINATQKEWALEEDVELLNMIKDVHCDIASLDSTPEQVHELAIYVSERMGGCISREDYSDFSYELHISQLKQQMGSNIIPIGKIIHGIYYHRALLFKVLADSFSLSCTLVRGDYGRAWNEVQIFDRNETGQPIFPPKEYVVDLMHDPGTLFPVGSLEAVRYQHI